MLGCVGLGVAIPLGTLVVVVGDATVVVVDEGEADVTVVVVSGSKYA